MNVSGKRIVVYNGLPWPRSGMVQVDGKLLYAKDVPANGYEGYPPDAAAYASSTSDLGGGQPAARENGGAFETPFYRVKIDVKRGGISSLVEKKTGREFVDQSSPYALGQFLHERFDNARMVQYSKAYDRNGGVTNLWAKGNMPKDAAYAALTPHSWQAVMVHSDVTDTVTFIAGDKLGLADAIMLAFVFSRDQPTVDVEWRVTKKKPDPLPEGGWLCFPFAVDQPQFRLGRLGGPIDPTKDILTGANKHYICLSTGLTIGGKDQTGVGLCPIDSPCVSLGEPGLWKYSLDYVPKKPTVFVNLYNNQWATNFPEWQGGSWTSRVRFWPTYGSDTAKDSDRPVVGGPAAACGRYVRRPRWQAAGLAMRSERIPPRRPRHCFRSRPRRQLRHAAAALGAVGRFRQARRGATHRLQGCAGRAGRSPRSGARPGHRHPRRPAHAGLAGLRAGKFPLAPLGTRRASRRWSSKWRAVVVGRLDQLREVRSGDLLVLTRSDFPIP